MKKLLVQPVTALMVLLVLTGCVSTKNVVAVHLNYEPRLAFKPDSTTILLINRVDFQNDGTHNRKTIAALQDGGYTSLKHIATSLKKLKHVKVIMKADSSTMKPVTDSVNMLARANYADYILALDEFTAAINMDDYTEKTAYYGTTLSLSYTLYEANGLYYKKLPATVNEALSESTGDFVISLIFTPSIKNNHASVNNAAQRATQQALQDYLPSELVRNRELLDGEGMNEAIAAIKANQLAKADSLLKPLIDHVNADIAYKSAYNKAIVYEMDGNIADAMQLAGLSLQKKKNRAAQDLLNDLNGE